jgi:hypothetical protein
MRVRAASQALGVAMLLALASAAARARPGAGTLLADLGYSPDEIARIEAGELVQGHAAASSPREVVVSFAFRVDAAPASLVEQIRTNLLYDVDPTVTQTDEIHGAGSLADLAGLTLGPDAATAYTRGSSDLNLSPDEIAAFAKLTNPSDVERELRAALLARAQAYRAKGLAGIAPYVRGGAERSPADELRSASSASEKLLRYVPVARALLLTYPDGKPAGLEEAIRWRKFDEHGVPTIHLEHTFLVADGEARVAVERQFYVNAGYNAAQSIAVFVPTDAGTIVVYTHRASTDQVDGLGGSIKRSLGNVVLASQLEGMLQKMQKEMKASSAPSGPAHSRTRTE